MTQTITTTNGKTLQVLSDQEFELFLLTRQQEMELIGSLSFTCPELLPQQVHTRIHMVSEGTRRLTAQLEAELQQACAYLSVADAQYIEQFLFEEREAARGV